MPNYQNGKTYRIVAYDEDENEVEYVGSTVQTVTNRMKKHRHDFKLWKKGEHSFCTAFDVLKYPNAKIYLIHNYPCNSREELEAEEGRVIQERKCVNKNLPGKTKEEKNKKRRDNYAEIPPDKKDQINAKRREDYSTRMRTQEQKDEENAKKRERRAARTQEQKDKENATKRAWRAARKQAKNNNIIQRCA